MKRNISLINVICLVLLCSVFLVSAAGAANPVPSPQSQDVPVNYHVGSEYLVTIPTSIDIGGSQAIGISKVVIGHDQGIFLEVDGGEYELNNVRRVFLEGADANEQNHYLEYNIFYQSSARGVNVNTLVGITDPICILASTDTAEYSEQDPYTVPLNAQLVSAGAIIHSGNYVDQVTVTISINTAP